MKFPIFTYHPDPLATGSIVPTNAVCPCCELPRGYEYFDSLFRIDEEIQHLCPWCIAEGRAAWKYNGSFFNGDFVDAESLSKTRINEEIFDIMTRRTPGFPTLGIVDWLCCCNDACEYQKRLSKEEIERIEPELLKAMLLKYNVHPLTFDAYLKEYGLGKKRSIAIHRFVCRHCRRIHLAFDHDW